MTGQEPLFSTSQDSSLIYSFTPFSIETNRDNANLSLLDITTWNLSWKGMLRIISTSTISRPQFRSDNDYEVLLQNGGHQILTRVDPSTLVSASSFSSPLQEPLQPVEVTDDTVTVTTTSFTVSAATVSTTSMTTTFTMTGTVATSNRTPSTDTDISWWPFQCV